MSATATARPSGDVWLQTSVPSTERPPLMSADAKTHVIVQSVEATSPASVHLELEPEEQEGPPRNVQATVKFIQWQPLYSHEKPFQIFIDPPPDSGDQRTTNLVYEDKDISIQDIRGRDSEYTLNEHGFHYLKHDFGFEDYESAEAVERDYLPKVEQLLRSQLGDFKKVFFFDWKLRTSTPAEVGSVIDLNNPTDWLRPSIHAHTDQSAAAVLSRIMKQIPDEAEELLKNRIRVVNVWKPLRNPVFDWPLAVCDGSNVGLEDLVETDHVRRLYVGSNMNLMYRKSQKWFYLHGQRADEVLLIKNFDSNMSVKTRWCPHVSFKSPLVYANNPVRESIEIRALVFSSPEADSD